MASRVLMIAFHFPPYGSSSGSRRTLAFSRYLPRHGWQPLVLTADVRAYEQIRMQELRDVPADLPVVRAFALDAARHFAIRGRYPSSFAVPDRWKSWQPFARQAGLRLIRQHGPKIIWSTYPIASAHEIGAALHERTGIPWVADMRDPMVEKDPYTGEDFPRDPAVRAARLRIEERAAHKASHIVFCTEGAREIFIHRWGGLLRSGTSVIPNGYDEHSFVEAGQGMPTSLAPTDGFRLIHSGTVYPGDDRGPRPLLKAIAELHLRQALPAGFQLILRATGYDAEISKLIVATATAGLVRLAPALPYREALQEMLAADGLLLLQGRASNPAVPAKLYEYLRARRPILALTHPAGETAALLARLNAAIVAPLDDANSIVRALAEFIHRCTTRETPLAKAADVAALSRSAQTHDLAALLTRVADAESSGPPAGGRGAIAPDSL